MQKKIRIIVVDDHIVMRQGLTHMIGREPDFEIAGEAKDGLEAVELAGKLQPDVILMDISMPTMDGIEATRIICRASPQIRILGLSMYMEEEMRNKILLAGAVAFVSKSESKEQLLSAIRASIR